jgi:hypothetical protein
MEEDIFMSLTPLIFMREGERCFFDDFAKDQFQNHMGKNDGQI